MTQVSIVSSKARGKSEPDKIFGISALANARAAEVGKENIVNATIGAFLDPSGKLITLSAVEKAMKGLEFANAADYAPIAGLPKYLDAAIEATFQNCRPDAFIKGVATPGGTGGLHHAIWNYLEEDETYITTDRFWGPYKTLARELNRKMDTFVTFDGEGNFNVEGCLEKVNHYAKEQKNVMLLLNTPAHNPTGFTVKDEEWDVVIENLTALANNGENNVVLVVDIAYLDFAPPESREFFKKFTSLPENFLVLITFSASKGYTLYGYRTGCLIGVSSSEEVINEFYDANMYSSRGAWSNCTRSGMLTLMELQANEELQKEFRQEQNELRLSLVSRADTFINEAKEIGLEICPYHSGFFITVPTNQADDAAAILRESDIFVVPLGQGLRIAICAIPEEQITGMAAKIKEALERLA